MYELERPPLKGIDRDRLEAVVGPIVRAHGAEVVDIEWKSDRAGWVLRVFVEKGGASEQRLSTAAAAVNLELCANVARDLSPALDVADLIPHSYHLEVSSPGVERPLRSEQDFARFEGQKAKLKLVSPVDGQTLLRGLLGPAEGGVVTIVDGRRSYSIPLRDIVSARLVFEFGAAPRPGKPGAAKPGKASGPKQRKPSSAETKGARDGGPAATPKTERQG